MTGMNEKKTWFWAGFGVLVVVGVGLFFVPAFVIRPFRYQSPRALMVAMTLRAHAPFWTALIAATVVGLAVWQWRRARWPLKTALAAGVVLVAFAATMARMNYFEWMFHPVAQPGFEATSGVKLDAGEMVLAVTFNNDGRAYPIREMAYHHIVNDVVGGVPVAVTY